MNEDWTPEEEWRRLAARFEGVKQAEFARKHKVPGGPSMVSQHIHGRRPIQMDAALAYARGFGVTLAEISPRLAAQAAQAAAMSAGAGNVEPGPDVRGLVPVISWVQAGSWNGAGDPYPPGVSDQWLACPATHSSRTYALRVRGDSMTAPYGRSYPEGCIVFVDPERKSPISGQRVIAKLVGSDEVTFKVFKNEDGRLWLQPLNPMHPPIHDPFRVLGTVIGKWEDE